MKGLMHTIVQCTMYSNTLYDTVGDNLAIDNLQICEL